MDHGGSVVLYGVVFNFTLCGNLGGEMRSEEMRRKKPWGNSMNSGPGFQTDRFVKCGVYDFSLQVGLASCQTT